MMMGCSGHCGGVHQIPAIWSVSPEHLYHEVAPRAKARSGLVLPFPDPSQAPETPEVTDHSRVQQNAAWDSGSSLTLGSSLSPSPSLHLSPSSGVEPSPSSSIHCCPEPISIVRIHLAHS
ncbi:hypothetical protein A6R68_12629 [Neotoma lepida]|uniref:Uncharacterized protein n=1 Tax=Neotoma lepida TaxID=56216 RepID=A0A1A6H2E3_NEOLE|nr:hypothetical protein A6R68_12629 [Neotoma lepida]